MIFFLLHTQHAILSLKTFNFSKRNIIDFNKHILMTTHKNKLFKMTLHKRWFNAYPLPNYMTKSHLVYQHNKMWWIRWSTFWWIVEEEGEGVVTFYNYQTMLLMLHSYLLLHYTNKLNRHTHVHSEWERERERFINFKGILVPW